MNARPSVVQRLSAVRSRLDGAARDAGRDAGEVTLVAVAKKHPARAIADLARAGHLDIGESYVQEAQAKQEELARDPVHCDLRWHFVGRLQRNKAKFVAGRFSLVHSVDSLKLAQTLHNCAVERGVVQDVLLQVNVAGESSKAGVAPRDVPGVAEAVADLSGLRLSGLMTMPPWSRDPEDSRPYFADLRRLRDGLRTGSGLDLPHLSMGMSADCAVAVAEGATLVRVGTDIFGPRRY
jgi:pyridoxal phosphate enzyme (YggS family)